jgi:DNA-binding CsgD family transcriptional regulator
VANERFLLLAAVQRELAVSADEALALIRRGDLPAIKLLGTWRVERSALEQFIAHLYVETALALRDDREGVPGDDGAGRPAGPRRPLADTATPPPDLTPQLRRVLELVAQGLSNSEVARELTLEVSTVKSHVSRLLSRLGLRDRETLIAYAWRTGVVNG